MRYALFDPMILNLRVRVRDLPICVYAVYHFLNISGRVRGVVLLSIGDLEPEWECFCLSKILNPRAGLLSAIVCVVSMQDPV